jgi:hypothetical protein
MDIVAAVDMQLLNSKCIQEGPFLCTAASGILEALKIALVLFIQLQNDYCLLTSFHI